MAKVSVFLIILVLIGGTIGCAPPPLAQYNLTISSTEGGSVSTPGEGTFTYDEGEVVELMAEADEGYYFVNWTGDVGTIADVGAATTILTMSGDYSITASFQLERTTGAFLDEVVITSEPDASAAIQQLKEDALDVYAFGLDDPRLYAEVLSEPGLTSAESYGLYYDFTFNPVGPTFLETGKLNPFSVPRFREAMHWLVDREYIAREIYGGLALPRYTCLTSTGADARERYPDPVAALEAKYTHNQTKAEAIVTEEMEKLGAVLEDGKWMYGGEPVELIGLIRTEDERKEMGDYFADLLEGLGFTVTRQYGTTTDLSPLWRGDPNRGVLHFYTGGWVNTVIARDEYDNFGAFYTNLWSAMGPL
jgi:peptide/nickel transport system substrate-binding protein